MGWDSEKPGYDGLIDVASQLMMKSKSNAKVTEAVVSLVFHCYFDTNVCLAAKNQKNERNLRFPLEEEMVTRFFQGKVKKDTNC